MENGKIHATELKNNEFVTQDRDYSHSRKRLCEDNILLNVADACVCGNEPSGSIKCREFLDLLQTR